MSEPFRGFWRGKPRSLGARVEDAAAFLQSVLELYLSPDWRVWIDHGTPGRLWIERAQVGSPRAVYRLQVTSDCRRLQFGHGCDPPRLGLDAVFRPFQEIDVVDLDRHGLARCVTYLMATYPPEYPPERLDAESSRSA